MLFSRNAGRNVNNAEHIPGTGSVHVNNLLSRISLVSDKEGCTLPGRM